MKIKSAVLLVLCHLCMVIGQCLVTIQQRLSYVVGYGLMSETPKGETFCSFLSIPYAKPPIGLLRFEPPQPVDLSEYSGLWDFTMRSPICIQNNVQVFSGNESGQEDCLYLNVYTKPTHWESPKPVIVWIHGGIFHYGSAYTAGADRPDYLVDEDVVFVSFNYRLGALGFLYRENDNFVANLGLRDQVEALKWIQSNIISFGGDPKRVTIMGWSAGSASVSYHLQAPPSVGLFQGAIMISGVSFSPFAYERNTESCVKALCESLNVPCTRSELKDALRNIPASDFESPSFLYDTTVSFFGESYPCFRPTHEGSQAFYGNAMVQDKHHKLIQHQLWSDVPVMMGTTSAELWAYYSFNRETLANKWNYSFPNTKESVIQPLRQCLISKTKEMNNESKRLIIYAKIPHGVKQFANYHKVNAVSNTYLYRFSHKNVTNDIGALHGDDLRYIFVPPNNDIPITEEDVLVRKRMVLYITNFAKYRDPTPKSDSIITERWVPYDKKSGLRMEIAEESKMVKDVKGQLYYRWEVIYQCLQFNNCRKFRKIMNF